MAKKTAIVEIQLEGLDTIESLQNELREVNAEIRKTDVNSEAFNVLAQRSSTVKLRLQEINQELRPLTSTQMINTIGALGRALQGAFQLGAGAAVLFGKETGEALQDIAIKAAAVIAAMNGIVRITRLFTANNIKGLKQLGVGFQALTAKIRGASAAMKGFMAATGIGLLVVGISLLVEHWDKLFKNTAKLNAELDKQTKQLDTQNKLLDEQNRLINDNIGRLNDGYSAAGNLLINERDRLIEIIGWEDERYKNILQSVDIENQRLDILNRRIALEQDADKKFELEIERQILEIGIDRLKVQQKIQFHKIESLRIDERVFNENKKITDTIAERQREINRLNVEGNRTAEIYQEQSDIIKGQIDLLLIKKRTSEGIDDALRETAGIVVESMTQERESGRKLVELREQEKRILDEISVVEKKRSGFFSIDKDKELKSLRDRLTITQDLVTVEEERFSTAAKTYQNKRAEFQVMLDNYDLAGIMTEEEHQQWLNLVNQLDVLEKQEDRRLELLRIELESLNFQRQYNQELSKASTYYADNYQNIENINAGLQQQRTEIQLKINELQRIPITLENELEVYEKIEAEKRKLIALDLDILNNNMLRLQDSRAELEMVNEVYDMNLKQVQALLDIAKAKLAGAKNDEGEAEALREVVALEAEVLSITNSIEERKRAVLDVDNDILAITDDIKLKNDELDDSIAAVEAKRAAAIQKAYEEQLEKLYEYIYASQDLLYASIGFIVAYFDRQAQTAQQRINELRKQLQDLEKAENDRGRRLLELERLLLDANAERHDEILAQIEEEKRATIDAQLAEMAQRELIEAQIAKQEDAKMEAEFQAAKWRKAQSLIDAAIAGVLATVKALPNIPLSILVGAMSVAGIATIAAQKLPPRPKAEQGMLVGASHAGGGIPIEAEGGEYIINKRSTSAFLPLIEAINNAGRKKYADGGGVGVETNTGAAMQLIDYKLLASEIAAVVPREVSVVEISKKQNRVRVIENRASI